MGKVTGFGLVMLICFSKPLIAQYKVEAIQSVPIVAIGINTMVTAMILKENKTTLSAEEINSLRREDINRFDRSASFNFSIKAQKTSDVLASTSLFLPIATLMQDDLRKNWQSSGWMVLEAYLLNAGITNITKEVVKRKRPFVYHPEVPASYKLKKDATSSFFSGHTSMTATSSFMTASLLQSQVSGNEAKAMIWIGSASIPAIVGYLRWKGGKHYLSDILVGYAVGAAIGILIPKIHETPH